MHGIYADHEGRTALHHPALSQFLKLLQLGDHPLDHAKAALPERGVARIEAERRKQLGVMLGAAGRQHGEIAVGKTFLRVLIDRVKRVHQAIAEGVSVNVKRRVDEMRNVRPERLLTGLEFDRRAEALALHLKP